MSFRFLVAFICQKQKQIMTTQYDTWRWECEQLCATLKKTPQYTYTDDCKCVSASWCSCPGKKSINFAYNDLECKIKRHLACGRFCACGRQMSPEWRLCPFCGNDRFTTVNAHGSCADWDLAKAFCASCGKASLEVPPLISPAVSPSVAFDPSKCDGICSSGCVDPDPCKCNGWRKK